MKKFTLYIFMTVFLLGTYMGVSQTLNQAASWPNGSWTLSGTFTPAGLLSDPTVAGTTFTWDDDGAGNGSADDLQATSPVIDLTAANGAGETLITISGDYVYRALGGDVLQIEVYDADALSWSALETFTNNSGTTDYQTCSATAAYTTAELDISGFTATQLSGFQYRITYDDQGGWQWGWCLTSPTITSAAPPMCIAPTALTLDAVDDESGVVSWSNDPSATGGVEFEFGATGFTPGTATSIASGGGVGTSATSGATLAPDTTYDFYVRSDCDANGFSDWAGPVTFTTPCAAVAAPYTEDFETFTTSTSAFTSENCWTATGAGSYYWESAPGSDTSSGGTGPSPTITTGNYFFIESSGSTAGNIAELVSVPVDLSPLATPVLTFDYHMFGGQIGTLEVLVNGTSEFSISGQQQTTDTDPFLEGVVDLAFYTGQTVTVTFRGTGAGTFEGDIAIDNVSFDELPACPDPSGLSATTITDATADLGWTENGTATTWDIEIVDITAAGTATGTPTDAGVTTNPYGATGLTQNNDYEFYVRADCGGGELSEWVGPFAFTTQETCPTPSALTATNIMETTADLGWTENGTATSWNVEIVDLTAAEAFTGTPTATGVTNPYAASGLVGDNNYEFYVQADCGVDGTSAWAGPFAFNTPYVAAPPSCSNGIFLDSGGTSTDYSNGENITYTICPDVPGDIVNVEFTFFSTENNGAAACYDGLTVHDGPDDLAATINPPGGGTIWCWDEDDNGGAGIGTGDLEGITIVSTDPSGCITFVFTSDGSVTREGWEAIVTCTSPPTCPAVTDIFTSDIFPTSVDIGWTPSGSETAWEYVVQAAGTGTPSGPGTSVSAGGPSVLLGGLTPNTDYEIFVRPDCGGGDFGNWFGPENFTTTCDPFTLPLVEGFESGVPPDCWDSFRGFNNLGTTHDWISSGTANSGSSSAFVRYSTPQAENVEDWLVTPRLDLSGTTNPELSFFARDQFAIDYGSSYTVRVISSGPPPNPLSAWTTVATYTEADLAQTFGQFTVDLSAFAGQSNIFVAFVLENNDGDSWYVDDVVIYDNVPTTFTYTSGTWAPFDPTGIVDFDDNIVIAAGDYTMDTDMTCDQFRVSPGAGATIESGVTLNNIGPIVMNSTSTSYSSIIVDGTVTGVTIYDRHVNINGTGTTGSNDLISAPVTGQQFNDFVSENPNILNNGTLYLFGPFEKNTGQYVTWEGTNTQTLDASVGYRAGSTDNDTFTFTGTIETGIVTNTILNQGTNNEEWNLIGNPYPSYMNVQDFLNHDGGSGTNISLFDAPTAAIWGYDGSALNGWTIFNLATTSASTVITPGQGFFVSSGSASATVEFTPAMRTTGSSDDFIVGRNAPLTYVTLSLTSDTNAYSTDFYFNANASEGFDRGYDAVVWGDSTPEFAIYSRLVQDDAGFDMALQALKDSDITNVTIPLGVNANQGQQITFSIHESTLPENVKVYLDDTVENTTTLLNASDYVMTPKGDLSGTGRFFLRYEEDALSSVENSLDALDIFTLNDTNELIVSGELAENAMLNLFDIQGRLVMSIELDKELVQNRIHVENINAGIYLATVLDSSQEKTKKVIIK